MDQNAAYSGSEWSLQRRPFQCVLGQASRAFSSMSIVAPNCCQRAVLHKGSICTPPGVMLILVSRVCLLVSMSILEFHFSPSIEVSVFCACRNEEHTAAFSHTRTCDLTLLLTKIDQDSGFLCIICKFRSPKLRKSLSKLLLSQKIVDNESGMGAALRHNESA